MNRKAQLRTDILARLAALTPQERLAEEQAMFEHVLAYELLSQSDPAEPVTVSQVLAYMPMGSEPAILPLLRRLSGRGLAVYLPCVENAGASGTEKGTMVFRQPLFLEKDALVRSPLGMHQPPADRPLWTGAASRALMLVPGLAFTAAGGRLGRGGGYYDRFLEQHPHIHRIALAYRCQIVPELPEEPHDIRVHEVFTADGRADLYYIEGNHNN